jgi:hypothetical protein
LDPTVVELADQTELLFGFLISRGYRLAERKIVAPEEFKGGFILMFASEKDRIRIQYLDMEIAVTRGDSELFGDSIHPNFEGNMFSREHLAKALARIADAVRRGIGEQR